MKTSATLALPGSPVVLCARWAAGCGCHQAAAAPVLPAAVAGARAVPKQNLLIARVDRGRTARSKERSAAARPNLQTSSRCHTLGSLLRSRERVCTEFVSQGGQIRGHRLSTGCTHVGHVVGLPLGRHLISGWPSEHLWLAPARRHLPRGYGDPYERCTTLNKQTTSSKRSSALLSCCCSCYCCTPRELGLLLTAQRTLSLSLSFALCLTIY